MRFLSLFSGIEAASLAWSPLGWKCVGFSEIEPFPCALLKHYYPETPNLGDITKITEEQIAALGHIDLVIFGSPCTDFSIAGKRAGLKDEEGNITRSGLFYSAMDIVRFARKHCGLRWSVLENVPGIYSSHEGRDFSTVIGEMVGCRFDVPADGWGNLGIALGPDGLCEWACLDAQHFGVAQRRRRVFAVTDYAIFDSGNWRSRSSVLLERESMRGYTAPSKKAGQGIAGTVTSRTGISGNTPPEELVPIGIDEECNASVNQFGPLLRGGQGGTRQAVCYENHTQKDIAGTLDASYYKGPGSHGGNERDYVVQKTVAFAQNTRDEVRLQGGDGQIAGALSAEPGMKQTTYIAVQKQPAIAIQGTLVGRGENSGPEGSGVSEECSFTLTKNDKHAVAYSPIALQDVSGRDKKPNGKGYSEDDVAYTVDAAATQGVVCPMRMTAIGEYADDDSASTVKSRDYKDATDLVCESRPVAYRTNAAGQIMDQGDRAATLNTFTDPSAQILQQEMVVRRLTPEECELLMGMPRGYTKIPWKKKSVEDCPDGPRYKALGNSFAVPVVAYIGRRIQKVMGQPPRPKGRGLKE